MQYRPDKILIEESAVHYPFCQSILQRYQNLPQIVIKQDQSLDEVLGEEISISTGKRTLYLKEFKGNAFKLCPGFSDSVLCCNYYVLDLVENCPLECTYCILQVFLNKPLITFHVNVESLLETMIQTIRKHPERSFRIGTGEHSDSLALDHIVQINPYLVETFSKLSNATLEIKTKTNEINSLKGLQHNGRTVVAWSLNPSYIIKSNEHKTASLQERLFAAKQLTEEGYKVAFHFDPLIHYHEWRKGYKETVNEMLDLIRPGDIAWISMGTLRYITKLRQVAEERFPKTAIFANEFTLAQDGKMRYIKPIRKSMLSAISGWISARAPEIPLYLCMEHRTMWNSLFSSCPATPIDLERYLSATVPPCGPSR